VLLRLKEKLGKQCYWAKNTGINVDSINSDDSATGTTRRKGEADQNGIDGATGTTGTKGDNGINVIIL
jgi:hypothetical protein